mgnify:FL=1
MKNKGFFSIFSKYWLPINSVFVAMGLLLSIYSTNHHIEVTENGKTDAKCNINSTFDCDIVALSEYSEFLYIPLGVWGTAYFLSLSFLLGLIYWRKEKNLGLRHAYGVLVFFGLGVTWILGIISLVVLKAACLVCIGIYISTIVLAIGVGRDFKEYFKGYAFEKSWKGLAVPVLVTLFVVTAYSKVVRSPLEAMMAPHKEQQDKMNTKIKEKMREAKKAGANQGVMSKVFEIAQKGKGLEVTKSPYAEKGEDYRQGNDNAKIVLVKYSDFECPACKRDYRALKPIKEEFKNDLLFVYKNYPLGKDCNFMMGGKDMHKYACELAILARCAGRKGKFWDFHDAVFDSKEKISEKTGKMIAMKVGLNNDQIAACMDDKNILKKIEDDIEESIVERVKGTPTYFINGEKFEGNLKTLRLKIRDMINGS